MNAINYRCCHLVASCLVLYGGSRAPVCLVLTLYALCLLCMPFACLCCSGARRVCRICTVLDKTSMFGVTSTKRDGEQKRHHVSSGRPCCASEKEHRTPRSSAHTRRQAASLLLALVVFFKRDVFSKFAVHTHKFYTAAVFFFFFPGCFTSMLSGCCRPCSMYACRDGFFFIAHLRRVLSC